VCISFAFYGRNTRYCNEKSGIKVCKELFAGTSALIILIPMYSKLELAKTQNRRRYGDFYCSGFER
ncbi:MAG: hypothetical protein IKE65_02295, partial [Clostridia bacterium]|nr:hypothetical protein [Clostridia bacterium]